MKDGFIFYQSFFTAIEKLKEDSDRLACYEAICRYGLSGEEPEEDDGITAAIFALIKPQIDANEKRREAGRKGGKATQEQNASKAQAIESEVKANSSKAQANESKAEPKDKCKREKENIKEKGKEKNKKESADERRDVFETCTPELKAEVLKFVEHRKKLRKPMTEHAIELLINKLNVIGVNDTQRIELLQTAIEHGWQTVYKPDDKKETRKAPAGKTNKFNQFEQRGYDYDELERTLLGIGGTQ